MHSINGRTVESVSYLGMGLLYYGRLASCGYTACPSGLVTVPRLYGNARDGEIMVDDQGCEGHGSHILCCPPDKGIPPCGWYGHRNGYCTGACPTDMIEIGSNNMFCNNAMFGSRSKGYQAACCSPVEGIGSHRVRFESLKLQNQCSWGSWPAYNGECDSSARPALLFSSFDGSGGATCLSREGRSLCCEEDEDLSFDQCDWYDDLGGGPTGRGACKSGCPRSRIRMGMESRDCRTGSRAMCCTAKSKRLKGRSDDFLEKYGDIIDDFLVDPTCPDSSNSFDVL